MKILIDTNVILDFFLSREPFATEAKGLFELIYKDKIRAFATASSITDIYYITAKRLGCVYARDAVKQLLKLLSVIAVDGNDCANALDLPMDDFEDALITICARKEEMDCIVSNDKDFLLTRLKLVAVVNAHDFLKKMV